MAYLGEHLLNPLPLQCLKFHHQLGHNHCKNVKCTCWAPCFPEHVKCAWCELRGPGSQRPCTEKNF